ncbi:MAG: flavodoxin family protein [Alkalicoccus sp.]|nr:MAG: flavodoxin family protein [Alkalicoccus sp.]
MKPVIIYFSHSGNNQKLAVELQSRIACDMFEIKEKKKRKNISIFVDFLIKRDSRLAPIDFDVSDYGPVLLLAPIHQKGKAGRLFLYHVMQWRRRSAGKNSG